MARIGAPRALHPSSQPDETPVAVGAQFETEAQVEAYVEATARLDARRDIDRLRELIGDGTRVLELGSGGGVDLEHLARHFDVVGSDPSAAVRRWITRRHRATAVLNLRAQDLADLPAKLIEASVPSEWARGLQAIFSSKVLHLLADQELHETIAEQARLLAPDGVAMHVVWAPRQASEADHERTRLRDEATLRRCWLEHFRVVEITPRSELGHHDLLRVTACSSRSGSIGVSCGRSIS